LPRLTAGWLGTRASIQREPSHVYSREIRQFCTFEHTDRMLNRAAALV
jgi:hypothetical protein